MVSMLMGFWLATSFAGNFLAGWLGSFWSVMDKLIFFLMIAASPRSAGDHHLGLRSAVAQRDAGKAVAP